MSLRTFASATLEKIILNLVFRYSLKKDFRTAHGDGWRFLYAFSEQKLKNKRIQR